MRIRKIKNKHGITMKLDNRKGSSLVELLATIAIMGIFGAMITGIIPILGRVLNSITTKSRAEMLLNNTVIELRNNLRYATKVKQLEENKAYQYVGNDEWEYVIRLDSAHNNWIVIAPLKWTTGRDGGESEEELAIEDESKVQDWHILTQKAASEKMVPTFEAIQFDSASGIFSIRGLKIINSSDGNKVISTYKGTDNNSKTLMIRTINEPLTAN